MITFLIADNEEKVKEMISEMLNRIGNTNISIVKQGETIKIVQEDSLKALVSLEEKIIELEDSLYDGNKGRLYKCLFEAIEKPLFEHILERTEGNQLKAARILGINRNTMRSKIKKLGINPDKWKI